MKIRILLNGTIRFFAASIVSSASVSSFGATTLSSLEVYATDFENAVGPEWSLGRRDTTPSGRTFLGRFENDASTILTLHDLPAHSSVSISFDLFIIHSWDGSDFGADTWLLQIAGGPVLLHTTFANPLNGTAINPQSYPGTFPDDSFPARSGADEVDTLGYLSVSPTRFGDTVYNLSFSVPHSEDSIAFEFAADGVSGTVLDPGIRDESWGIDNVSVSVVPEPAMGVMLLLGLSLAFRRRRQS